MQRHLHNYCKVTHRDIFISILRTSPYSWFNSTWIQLRDNPITRHRNCSSDNIAANRKDRRFNPGKCNKSLCNKSLGSRLNHSTHVQWPAKPNMQFWRPHILTSPWTFVSSWRWVEINGTCYLPCLMSFSRDEYLCWFASTATHTRFCIFCQLCGCVQAPDSGVYALLTTIQKFLFGGL